MNGRRIMIVDDNKELLEELRDTLSLCGYDARVVSDSEHAPRLARKMRPDAVLLDLRMNKMNGFQVAEQLKNSPVTGGIPIIAMSGYFPLERNSILLDMSKMDGWIKKPFGIADLITQIETVLQNGAKTAGLSAGGTVGVQ